MEASSKTSWAAYQLRRTQLRKWYVCVCLCVFLAHTYSRRRGVSGSVNLGHAEEGMGRKRHGGGAVGRISFQLLA